MPDRSTSQKPTGSQPAAAEIPNDSGLYIANAPAWWHPHGNPAQVVKVRDYLLTLMSPEAFKARPANGLLLYGHPGTGKTSAGLGVLYDWGRCFSSSEGIAARFQDFGELMVRIRSSWRKDARQTVDEIHAEMFRPKILMLDDIGKRATPEDQETISTLVNGRINRGKPTIVTTNSDLTTPEGRAEFLAACDSRVLERYSRCDINVAGQNLRRNP
jgi:DNA replication protein DnaC